MRVMVIAGTADAKEIINQILKTGAVVVATVTTSYGKELLEVCSGVEIVQGKMDASAMSKFIYDHEINCLVDASHPFAREASVNAIKAASGTKVPYIRFEREDVDIDAGDVIRVKDFLAAAKACCNYEGNILLAIGSNNLNTFSERLPDYKNRLFARILPDSRMVIKCEEAGLTAGNIIAIKGPFSVEMNIEMLKHCKASVLVTKESGETGGTCEKLEAAKKLGVTVIIVDRPEIDYERKVSKVEEIIEFVKQKTYVGRNL
jgi:precorrin-6A/cobalt-precorrin-6A reductase